MHRVSHSKGPNLRLKYTQIATRNGGRKVDRKDPAETPYSHPSPSPNPPLVTVTYWAHHVCMAARQSSSYCLHCHCFCVVGLWCYLFHVNVSRIGIGGYRNLLWFEIKNALDSNRYIWFICRLCSVNSTLMTITLCCSNEKQKDNSQHL